MTTLSIPAGSIATQTSAATRSDRLARVASLVGEKVGALRVLMVLTAPRGLASALANAMGWRIERRSRELNGSEKLSVAGVLAEIELHRIDGRGDVVSQLVGVLLGDLVVGEIELGPKRLIEVFERNGRWYARAA